MQFCPASQDLFHPWNNGLNRCFLWTISTIISLLLSVFAIIIYSIFLCCYSSRAEQLNKSIGFKVQKSLSFVNILIICVHVLIFAVCGSRDSNSVSGFTILYAIGMPLSWIGAFCLLLLENSRDCPKLYLKRHGFPLILFWTVNFILINLPLLSIRNDSFWWKLKE